MMGERSLKVSRGFLIGINAFLIIVSVIVITVGSLAKVGSYVSSLNVIAGIITSGCLLLFVSVVGLWGGVRANYPVLVIYMILLVIVFLIQFSVSIAALAVDHHTTAEDGWCALDNTDRTTIQQKMQCYGFQNQPADYFPPSSPDFCMRPGPICPSGCSSFPDCPVTAQVPVCPPCYEALKDQIATMLNRAGGIGLAFAFTELIGIFAAYQFRKARHEKPKYHEFLYPCLR